MRPILWLLIAAAVAHGQERFQFYTSDNGLPNNSVLALLQTNDGYLWFTTRRGLVRFDGVHFKVFDENNTPAIHSTNFAVYSLMQDHAGAIWAGSWNGAIRYFQGTFTSFTTRDGLPNNRVLRIDEDEHGTIWFYCEGGLSRLRGGKLETVHLIDGEPVEPYFGNPPNVSGEEYTYGLIRLKSGSGLQRFAYGRWTDIPLPPGEGDPAAVHIELTAEDTHHRLWYRLLHRQDESFCVQDGRLTVFRGLPAGAFATYEDRFGRLWITDGGGRSAVWQNGRATALTGISTSMPLRVLEDREGSFWVGTLNQGLAHAPIQIIRSTRLPGGPASNAINSIAQDAQGDLWIASNGLTRMHAGRFETFMLPHSMAPWPEDQIVTSLWTEPDGTVLLGNRTGLKVFRKGIFSLPERPLQQITDRVNAILRDRAGNLWLGDAAGAHIDHDSKLTLVQAGTGMSLRGEVRALAEDRTGTVWIGTDAVVCRFRNGALTCFGPSDPLYFWRIRSIAVDRDNVVWVSSSDRGLLRIEGDNLRWIQTKDGLYSNDTGSILADRDGDFWIGSGVGIFRVSRQEMNAVAQGRAERVISSYFGKSDGLNDASAVGYGQPRGIVANDGNLWFATADGIATLNPAIPALDQTPPHAQIDSCFLEGKPLSCDPEISLPPDAGDLEINYTALKLVRSDQIQFRYRLDGVDRGWVSSGARRTAYYSHLEPGTYRFLVVAANSFGNWNSATTELTVIVQHHFYQTLWFRLLVVASMLGAFWLMWRLRGLQYSKRQARQRAFAQQIIASQETERKRIAAELHDSLGQRLTVIRNMAMLMNRPGARPPQQQIEAIAAETAQAIAEVRSISRNLRPYQLDLLGLTKAIEVLVTRTCEAAGMNADLVLDDLAGAFRRDLEIHFYRIVQESLGNAVRHSRAATIRVTAQRTQAGVFLIVSDDGVGFAAESPSGNGVEGGFGLTGISERAMLLGGSASIRSAPGQGTTVTIEIAAAAMEHQPEGVQEHT